MDEPRRRARARDPDAALEKSLPRNVAGILLFELTWGLGIPFGLFISTVPAYLAALGSSKSLMGFVQAFWAGTTSRAGAGCAPPWACTCRQLG